MCEAENIQTLQRGMNFRLSSAYSVILMSQRSNAPYKDKVQIDGVTIEYEGHDVSRNSKLLDHDPKVEDQPTKLPSGRLTQNGFFVQAVDEFSKGKAQAELVKVYEKVFPGVWSLKGYFDLVDYKVVHDGKRNVFRYFLKLSEKQDSSGSRIVAIERTRLIPSEVKREVWKRDEGKCVICGDTKNLHFDHDLPYAKGGTSLFAKNVRLLCVTHNLAKSDKIE